MSWGGGLPTTFASEAVQDAMASQSKIGFDNFLVRFIVNEWVDVLTWEKTEHP